MFRLAGQSGQEQWHCHALPFLAPVFNPSCDTHVHNRWGGAPWESKEEVLFFSASPGAAERGNRSNIFKIQSPLFKTVPKPFPLREYGKYQYLVYAYGHCGWSRRLHELAFMNAVVFMEESSCREFMHWVPQEGKRKAPVKSPGLAAEMLSQTRCCPARILVPLGPPFCRLGPAA